MQDDEDNSAAGETFIDVASSVAGSAAGLALAGPAGALAGAATGPLVKASLTDVLSRITNRRHQKADYVIRIAAKTLGVSPDVLMERMESDPEREALLIRTLRAAQDETSMQHLIALAASLVMADRTVDDEGKLAMETAFVRALAECDPVHIRLLAGFVMTANDLGLGDGTDPFNSAPDGLNGGTQLAIVSDRLGLGNTLDYLLSTLEHLGLIRNVVSGEAAPPMITKTVARWHITEFGKEVLNRLRAVGDLRDRSPDRA